MIERGRNHQEQPQEAPEKKNLTAFIKEFEVDAGEKVLRIANDGSTDSWNVDQVEKDNIYLSRAVSNKEQPERAQMSRKELAQEQFTLETSQKLLEQWPKIIESTLKNLNSPDEKKALLARLESTKLDAIEAASLNVVLKELEPDSEEARALLLDTATAIFNEDVSNEIHAGERNDELEKSAKKSKKGALSSLAFGTASGQTIKKEISRSEDQSPEVTISEKTPLDLETRLAQKDAAFNDFVIKANINSRKFKDRSMSESDWKRFAKQSEDAIASYLEIAGDNPSITDEERLAVMRSHLEAIKSHELISIAQVEYTPDENDDTEIKELFPSPEEAAEDLLWKNWENDMHIVENDIAARQASGKPFSAETLKKDRELLKRDLDKYMEAALKEPNPAAEKNIDRAIAFLATLDVLAHKAKLTEEQDESEENAIDPDATPVMAPNREASEPSSRNSAKNTNINAGSSLMTDAIKAGYKPKPPAQALVDWIKNIFS